jgi:tetratricopeptide (TPR) repeat protein
LDPDALLEDLPAQDPDDPDTVEGSDEGQGSHGVPGFETTALAAPPAEETEPVSASEPELEARPESEPTPDATEAGETGSPPVEEIEAHEPATEPWREAEALDDEPEEDPSPLPTLDLDGDESRPAVGESAPLAEGSAPPAAAPAAQPGDVGLATPRPTPRDLRSDDESEVRLSARDEAAALLVRGQDLLSLGHVEEGLAALDRAHRGFAEADDLAQAMRVVREMILHDPGEVDHHQRLVEYAFRFEDHDLLVPAYLGLADCLSRNGDQDRAEAILGQVLQIDPHNEQALQGLRDRPAPDPEEKPAVASSTDYVDLGSLILDHEREKTTRWTVAADAPSGDEDADFKKMLAQFKAKVAENLDLQDVRAHYDLGTAYKEMGLLDEAIAEFQAALRADPSHLPTYELLGQCFLDLGKSEVAIRSLGRALHLSPGIEDEMLGIYYNLGRAHENVGNVDDAMEFYEKVFALDINFMDVTERLRGLR